VEAMISKILQSAKRADEMQIQSAILALKGAKQPKSKTTETTKTTLFS
jgi:hypothetical protein